MIKLEKRGYVSDRYDDPDSTAGSEYRIYLAGQLDAIRRLAAIIDAVRDSRLHGEAVLEIKGRTRDRLNLMLPTQHIVTRIGQWRDDILFRRVDEVELYLMFRTRPEDDRLVEFAMRCPPGCFK